MRPLIRYDLSGPPTVPAASYRNSYRPPTKKRKRNHHNSPGKSHPIPPLQHWDDPGNSAFGVVYDEEGSITTPAPFTDEAVTMTCADDVREEEKEYGESEKAVEGDEAVDVEEEEEESRPLTHEEIWDDAALMDAWNSAEAEYEAYHGGSKTEPVKKSPLWYNKPYTALTPKPGPSKPEAPLKHTIPSHPQEQENGEPEPDTAPLDFHTYVPTHDPSLAVPSDAGAKPTTVTPFFVPPLSTTTVSRDEAFNNALSAMYWSGYWTAVYHCQSQSSEEHDHATAEATEDNGIEADGDEDKEDLVPAQR